MIRRRNSTIEFTNINNQDVVIKKYHDTYNVEQEYHKIKNLSKFLNYSSTFRSVNVIEILEDKLILESLSGNCYGELSSIQINNLMNYTDEFIDLFLNCNKSDYSFDSDLSNLFFSQSNSQFIFIDPIQEDLKINNLSFIVFSLSILKSIGKSKNIFLYAKKITFFKALLRKYVANGNLDSRKLKISFYKYINVVIHWNIKKTDKKKLFLRLFRIMVLVPIWQMVKLFIKNLNLNEKN